MYDEAKKQVKTRVLHVVSGDLWAGAENQVYALIHCLSKRYGIEVFAVILNDGLLAEKLHEAGIATEVVSEKTNSLPQIYNKLCSIVHNWRPDVIHSHRQKEHVLSSLAARRYRIPWVATIHGSPEHATGLRRRLARLVERLVLRFGTHRIVAVSETLKEELARDYSNVVVILNGISPDYVKKRAVDSSAGELDERACNLVFVGRLVPVKQVDRLIELISHLGQQADHSCILHVIGEGPLRADLEDLVTNRGLSRVVRFYGFLEEPLTVVAQMDAMLFGSKHEGLPIAALEALCLGVPVFGPNVGGLGPLIRESKAGDTISMSNLDDAAHVIISRLQTSESKKSASCLLPRGYTIEASTLSYKDMYQRAVR